MNKDGILFFTPNIGDTILATTLANKIEKITEAPVYVANRYRNMETFTTRLGGRGFHEGALDWVMERGWHMGDLKKAYHGGKFRYWYEPTQREAFETGVYTDALLSTLAKVFGRIYILHPSYTYARLGQTAKKLGLEVFGYLLNEKGELCFSNAGFGERLVETIWSPEYIGNRLSLELTGERLNRQDFPNLPEQPHREGAKLFPTTRSKSSDVGNWDMDTELLRQLGIDYSVLYHHSETRPAVARKSLNEHVLGDDPIQTAYLVGESEFVICYDSAAFHFAWLTGTPAVVKLKGGFNEEWVPPWVKNDPDYLLLPAVGMYEEEYTYLVRKWLGERGYKASKEVVYHEAEDIPMTAIIPLGLN